MRLLTRPNPLRCPGGDFDGHPPSPGLDPPMPLAPEPLSAPPPGPVYTGPGWNLVQRLAFRFAFAYLILYIFPFPIPHIQFLVSSIQEIVTGEEPDPNKPPFVTREVLQPYGDLWDKAVLWTGKEVFGVEIEYRPSNSGDPTWSYVQVFDYAVLAAAFALLWTVA